jgi:hypothetical protein
MGQRAERLKEQKSNFKLFNPMPYARCMAGETLIEDRRILT